MLVSAPSLAHRIAESLAEEEEGGEEADFGYGYGQITLTGNQDDGQTHDGTEEAVPPEGGLAHAGLGGHGARVASTTMIGQLPANASSNSISADGGDSSSGGRHAATSMHGSGSSTSTRPLRSSPLPFTRGGSLLVASTPEDRQRVVAHMLARGGSFSEKHGVGGGELTPDSNESSPSSTPFSRPMAASSAPPPITNEMDFSKEDIAPAKSFTSGLAGIHRPSMGGIQTPNRYAAELPAPVEYSASGQRKAKLFKCRVFLPTHTQSDCVQMSLKSGMTAAQLVVTILSDYLRTHSQPAPTMLGQPVTYRLYLAEEDGELDDEFPPLDPSCVVSTTGADCFCLQRRLAPSSSAQSSVRSVSRVAGPSQVRPRLQMAGFGVEDGEPLDGERMVMEDGSVVVGGGLGKAADEAARQKGRRTSSDAGDEEGRSRAQSAAAPVGAQTPVARTKSFTPFTWKRIFSCKCVTTEEDQAAPIEPNARQTGRY